MVVFVVIPYWRIFVVRRKFDNREWRIEIEDINNKYIFLQFGSWQKFDLPISIRV